MSEKASPHKPTVAFRVVETITLSIATLVLLAVFIISGLAGSPNPQKYGFKNSTAVVSDIFYTQITPAGYTFSVWGVIYFMQILWIIYGWSFVFRPSTPRAISYVSYIFYTITNLCNIIWVYVWGNEYPQASFGVIVVCVVSLYATLVAQAIFLYKQTPALQSQKKFKIDLYITRTVVVNGLVLYASWLTAATQINFVVVLQYFGGMSATDAGTVGLSILLVEITIFFILENTVLDRFTRYVFVVYPLFIWAFTGVLVAHWGVETDNRNPIFTVILLTLCIVLFIVRIVLWIVFAFVRPLAVPTKNFKV